jgi:hypothetical protein
VRVLLETAGKAQPGTSPHQEMKRREALKVEILPLPDKKGWGTMRVHIDGEDFASFNFEGRLSELWKFRQYLNESPS